MRTIRTVSCNVEIVVTILCGLVDFHLEEHIEWALNSENSVQVRILGCFCSSSIYDLFADYPSPWRSALPMALLSKKGLGGGLHAY